MLKIATGAVVCFSELRSSTKTRLMSLRGEKGATAVEYVLIVGGIAAVLGLAIAAFGGEIKTQIEGILP